MFSTDLFKSIQEDEPCAVERIESEKCVTYGPIYTAVNSLETSGWKFERAASWWGIHNPWKASLKCKALNLWSLQQLSGFNTLELQWTCQTAGKAWPSGPKGPWGLISTALWRESTSHFGTSTVTFGRETWKSGMNFKGRTWRAWRVDSPLKKPEFFQHVEWPSLMLNLDLWERRSSYWC